MKTYQTVRSYAIIVLLLLCSTSRIQAQPDPIPFTQWLGGVGDWFDPTRWSAGVPNGDEIAEVANGRASFDSEAHAYWLWIGTSGPVNQMGSVNGTADLVIEVWGWVGESSGTGTGTTEAGNGKLTLTGGDLRVIGGPLLPGDGPITADLRVGSAGGTGTNTSFTGTGELNVTNGDIMVPVSISVGVAGGTGTNTTMVGRGNVNLVGGTLTTQRLGIGTASGTGSANATAVGEVTVTAGNIILQDSLLDDAVGGQERTSLTIGSSGGTGSFDGHATGTLRVVDGSVVADDIVIGQTSPISLASGSSQGNLYLEDSNLDMMTMTLGASSNNGGPATGLFQQIGGITTGNSVSLGPTSKIVLGIGGPMAGVEYSQILVDNASLSGLLEARFIDGFQPASGAVFDLVVADNISGSYDFQITGINLANYPNLAITQNEQLIRLAFLVPEPGTIAVVILSSILLVAAAGRRSTPSSRPRGGVMAGSAR